MRAFRRETTEQELIGLSWVTRIECKIGYNCKRSVVVGCEILLYRKHASRIAERAVMLMPATIGKLLHVGIYPQQRQFDVICKRLH